MQDKQQQYKSEFRVQSGQEAYTLIEVLMTIVIMGVILLMLNLVLFTVVRTANQTDARMKIRGGVEFALEVIRRDIKSANTESVNVSGAGGTTLSMTLTGSGDTVTFTRVEDSDSGYYAIQADRNGQEIHLTSVHDLDVTGLTFQIVVHPASGTSTVYVAVTANSAGKKQDGTPIVEDFIKNAAIITKGRGQ
ncbi:MAG: type II secretion system protein [Patescibacteria group bacterium]|nr:type II secretion system protein [Patescibacteria group bacterium]